MLTLCIQQGANVYQIEHEDQKLFVSCSNSHSDDNAIVKIDGIFALELGLKDGEDVSLYCTIYHCKTSN